MPALATDLLLIARDPVSGRPRHRGALDRALRAALFVELVFAGRLASERGAPHVTSADPLDDHVLDTLRSAVAARPAVAWRRWYHHVAADREVLTRDLVESGRWRPDRDRVGRAAWHDTDQDASLALTYRVLEVAERRRAPADRDEAVLAMLTIMAGAITGRPRPREVRKRLNDLLDAIGPASSPTRRDVHVALAGAGWAMRRRRRGLG